VGTTLEMQQKKTKGRLEELRALSQKAENGNPEARRELKRAVRESSPEIVVEASDFARRGQRILAEGYGSWRAAAPRSKASCGSCRTCSSRRYR
jgi:hypothetical protein